MSEDKKSLIDLVPDSVDNAVKNITDKPTQNMGTTLADIWYLVFGGISQAAEKRKLRYSYALQEFENELKKKISEIPEDKLAEPNIQIIAKALENAKYCVEEEDLRHMFSSLIASSMNKDFSVPPIMVTIISSLSPRDAKILDFYYSHDKKISEKVKIVNELHMDNIDDVQKFIGDTSIHYDELKKYLNASDDNFTNSIIELEHLNLICSSDKDTSNTKMMYQNIHGTITNIANTRLSILGYNFCSICLR